MAANQTISGPSGPSTIAAEWTMITIVMIVMSIRLYVRTKLLKMSLILSDYLLLTAFTLAFGHSICDILMFQYGILNSHYSHSAPDFPNNPEEILQILKVFYAASFPFYSALYFSKFSILAFIYTIFPPHEKTARAALYFVSGATIIFWIINMFLCAFYCYPVSKNWSFEPTSCRTIGSRELFDINWAFNITSDIGVLLLPFLILPRLVKLPIREKVGLTGIFSLGLITIGITLARFISVHETESSLTSVLMWSSMDQSTGLIVACLPSLRPLFQKAATSNAKNSNEAESESQNRHPSGDDSEKQMWNPTSFVTAVSFMEK